MNEWKIARRALTGIVLAAGSLSPCVAYAWGDEGHEIVATIAEHYLKPAVRTKVAQMLSADTTHLTPTTDTAVEATWADKYRDSDRNTTQVRYKATRNWHFVNLEIGSPDLAMACFNRPPLPSGTATSQGPADDCVVDKINEFAAELQSPGTSAEEKRLALQFILHFVGDLHQPLHASDEHDQGGNQKTVKAQGTAANSLHHYWDTEFVVLQGTNPQRVASKIVKTITPGQVTAWSKGTPDSWAKQSYDSAKLYAYAGLGTPDAQGRYTLSSAYVTKATSIAARQLGRAGVRLAKILNTSLE